MGIVTYETEVASAIPASKMFKAFVLDADNLIPKVIPQAISSVEIIQGDGGVGTIKKINFGQGSQFKYVKHQIDVLDKENLKFSYTVIEGDALMNILEKISNELVIVERADGGSICKTTSKYYTIGDVEIKEEDIKAGKEKASGMFKALEAYLLANPDAY